MMIDYIVWLLIAGNLSDKGIITQIIYIHAWSAATSPHGHYSWFQLRLWHKKTIWMACITHEITKFNEGLEAVTGSLVKFPAALRKKGANFGVVAYFVDAV